MQQPPLIRAVRAYNIREVKGIILMEILGYYFIGFYLARGLDVKDYYTEEVTIDDDPDYDEVFYVTRCYYNDYYNGKDLHKIEEIILRDSSKYDFTKKFKMEIDFNNITLIEA